MDWWYRQTTARSDGTGVFQYDIQMIKKLLCGYNVRTKEPEQDGLSTVDDGSVVRAEQEDQDIVHNDIGNHNAKHKIINDEQLAYCIQSCFLTPLAGDHSAEMTDQVTAVNGGRNLHKVIYYGCGENADMTYDADARTITVKVEDSEASDGTLQITQTVDGKAFRNVYAEPETEGRNTKFLRIHLTNFQ